MLFGREKKKGMKAAMRTKGDFFLTSGHRDLKRYSYPLPLWEGELRSYWDKRVKCQNGDASTKQYRARVQGRRGSAMTLCSSHPYDFFK